MSSKASEEMFVEMVKKVAAEEYAGTFLCPICGHLVETATGGDGATWTERVDGLDMISPVCSGGTGDRMHMMIKMEPVR